MTLELYRMADDGCPHDDEVDLDDEPIVISDPEPVTVEWRFAKPEQIVGHLTPYKNHYGVLCLDCVAERFMDEESVGAPVFGVNINPYMVVCCNCKQVVVRGCGVELYNGR